MPKFLLATVITFVLVSTARADTILYTFTGTIPSGASSHPMVADGESFTAVFQIDDTTVDSDPGDSTSGVYNAAVIAGSLEFSGGFTLPSFGAGLPVAVSNNQFGSIEGVSVFTNGSVANRIGAVTTDLNAIDSDALPGPGTSFVGNSTSNSIAFAYADSDGSIQYLWSDGETISLTVTAIPEPLVVMQLLSIGALSLVKRRREI